MDKIRRQNDDRQSRMTVAETSQRMDDALELLDAVIAQVECMVEGDRPLPRCQKMAETR